MSRQDNGVADRTGPAGAAEETDVCVVGAGPAGLSVACGLLGSGLRVTVVEAGATDLPELLTEVRADGEDAYPQSDIMQTRASGPGGTSGIWSFRMQGVDEGGESGPRGCRYAPLDPVDFEARPEIPNSGWPLTRNDLEPWYRAAQPLCGLGSRGYDVAEWSGPAAGAGAGAALGPLPLDPARVESQMFQFGPASAWGRDAVRRLRAGGVRILTEVAVVGLDPGPGPGPGPASGGARRIAAVRARRPDGSDVIIRARTVVLAAGGIENNRLLLIAGREGAVASAGAGGQVGRYWMEHPLVRGGLLVTRPGTRLGTRLGLYDAHRQDGGLAMAKLSIAPDIVRAEGLLSTSALLLPREAVLAARGVQAFTAIRSPSGRAAGPVRKAAMAGSVLLGARSLVQARTAIAAQPGLDHSGWTRRPDAARWEVFELVHQTEQSPAAENRITLTDERDRLGRPIPRLTWHWSQDDRRRITRSRDRYAGAFAAAGLGRVIQRDWEAGRPRMLGGNHHHLGGTRMSVDPADGVVDPDCRVHGTANLFVAGSSVFPTGGSVNPTLTIVALALRLADHLRHTPPS